MGQITIVATLKIKPQFTQETIQFLTQELINQSRSEAGNSQYDLHQDKNDPNKLVIIEQWASQQAIDEHNTTVHFKNFLAFIDGKTEMLDISLLEKI